jgi:pilus assembly protein CpaC
MLKKSNQEKSNMTALPFIRQIKLALSSLLFIYTGQSLALELSISEGYLINLPSKATTIFIANPSIASYQVPAADKIFIFGRQAGNTNLYALDTNGSVIFSDQIKVQHNTTELNAQIAELYPQARVEAISNNGQLLLKGTVPSAIMATAVIELARSYMVSAENEGSNAGEQKNASNDASNAVLEPINQLAVTLPNQVNIRVRIAEVSRTVTTQLGLHPGENFLGMQNTNWSQPSVGSSSMDVNQAVGKVIGVDIFGSLNKIFGLKLNSHSIMLDALAKEGAAKLLAEPNLTAMSGETATFMAGGEFPIPVSLTQNGQVVIEYKQYGVLLNITPTVLSDRRISLKIEPEVSSLDLLSAQTFNGLSVPAIKARRAKTTVELASGESFMLAGLLMNDESNSVSKFPFLGDIPVLGALFRSTNYNRNETELVIIAEAYVVEPSRDKNLALPTDFYTPYSDLERLFNVSWQQNDVVPSLSVNDKQPRLLGDNGFYY